jgi:hypothetical protein
MYYERSDKLRRLIFAMRAHGAAREFLNSVDGYLAQLIERRGDVSPRAPRPCQEIVSGTARIWPRISPPGFLGVWTFT